MESESGEDLSWWWRGWYFNNWQLDLGVRTAHYVDDDPAKGARDPGKPAELVMPATCGSTSPTAATSTRVPVETWLQRRAPELTLPTQQRILHVSIDPDAKLPDRDRGNNRFEFPG